MNDSAPPPPSSFPSHFSGSSTAAGTSAKAKRQSLNLASSTGSAAPRPLHLALGTVVGASSSPSTPNSSSPSPSPGPSSSVGTSAIHSSVISAVNGVSTGSQSQHQNLHSTGSTSREPSPSPLSPTITGLRKHPPSRRQSSISYISSNGHSPSHVHFGNGKRDSSDTNLLRSPLASVHPTTSLFGDAPAVGLTRSRSLGGRGGPRSARSPVVGERSSTASLLALPSQDTSKDTETSSVLGKERPPVTLAEKHAELLHFIAQKESKCLELRSQLAVHEAELLQLKRKWERIVNRGFDKALSPSSTTSPVPPSSHLPSPSPNSPFSPTAYSSSSTSSASNPSSYFPTLTPTTNTPGAAVVLEGIKGGVQGMSRLIAAGFESIVNVNGPATPIATHATPTSSANETKGSGKPELTAPLPLRLGSASTSESASVQGKRHYAGGTRSGDALSHYREGLGHGQKESQSSESTTTSAGSSTTFSSLLSASTATSATSAGSSAHASVSGSSTSGNTTRESASASSASLISGSSASASASDADRDTDADADSEFGDFEDGQPSRSGVDGEGEAEVEDEREQVLMVDDTGATPTMSPNPAFRRGGRGKRKELEQVERLVLPGKVTDPEEFDWDDGWDESASQSQTKDPFGSSANPTNSSVMSPTTNSASSPTTLSSPNQDLQQPQSQASTTAGARSKSPTAPGSLPLSSIPGLATMGMAAPSAQQMSSWVGTVGKRWGEIKGSTTFTKNQKRASVLLSDMQQSIVSALISPTTTTGTPTPSSASSTQPPQTQTQTRPSQTLASLSASPFSSNAAHSHNHNQPTPSSSSKPTSKSKMPQASLLDDSDDESFGESGTDVRDGADRRPSSKMTAPVMVPDSLSSVPASGQAKRAVKAPVKSNQSPKDAEEDEWNW